MALGDDPVANWLSGKAADPAVRRLASRELLGKPEAGPGPLASSIVQGLLAGLDEEDTCRAPYRKWRGAHWRLVSLVELGVPADLPAVRTACGAVLDHWFRPERFARVPVVDGRARRCASQEGNAVAVAVRLGFAQDERVAALARHLVGWQWPDGGWNCDVRPEACHSSFHETLPALWGLAEYAQSTGDVDCHDAAGAAAEFLLRHRVVTSERTGELLAPAFLVPHYPPYWHYDLLAALLVLQRAGYGKDDRGDRARELLCQQRRPDGRWRARRWWRPGSTGSGVEAVDWGDVAHQMATLNALRVVGDRIGPQSTSSTV